MELPSRNRRKPGRPEGSGTGLYVKEAPVDTDKGLPAGHGSCHYYLRGMPWL